MEAELRDATLKRLAEVLGSPEEEFEASEASQQIPYKTELKISTELEVSRACCPSRIASCEAARHMSMAERSARARKPGLASCKARAKKAKAR